MVCPTFFSLACLPVERPMVTLADGSPQRFAQDSRNYEQKETEGTKKASKDSVLTASVFEDLYIADRSRILRSPDHRLWPPRQRMHSQLAAHRSPPGGA